MNRDLPLGACSTMKRLKHSPSVNWKSCDNTNDHLIFTVYIRIKPLLNVSCEGF